MSESTGRMGGLGITTPSANLVNYLISGDLKFIDWGVLLVLGIFIGSYIAAKGSKEFRWRLPDIKTPAIVRLVVYLWDLVLQLQVVALSVMV